MKINFLGQFGYFQKKLVSPLNSSYLFYHYAKKKNSKKKYSKKDLVVSLNKI